jgi:hypothetical protein
MKKAMFASLLFLTLASGARAEQFLLFGEGGKYFAAHLNNGEVNYNQVVSINQPYKLDLPACHKRFCPDSGVTAVGDEQLPLIIEDGVMPTENTEIGYLNGVLAHVNKVIYADGNKAQ